MLAEQANLYASLQEWSLRKSQAKKVKSQKFGIRSPSRLRNAGWLICMHSLIYIIVQTFCEGFISVGQFCKTIELQIECFIRRFCNPRFSPKFSCSLQIALISGWLKNCKLKPTASRECREWYILSRSSPTNSEKKHNILSCFLFFFVRSIKWKIVKTRVFVATCFEKKGKTTHDFNPFFWQRTWIKFVHFLQAKLESCMRHWWVWNALIRWRWIPECVKCLARSTRTKPCKSLG